jgi:hypothetical protein
MEGERGSPGGEHEAHKAKEQQIIDALPADIRTDPELVAEIDRDALKEYRQKAEKLASLAYELHLPTHINWFSYEGDALYKQKQQEAGVEPQFTKLAPPYPWLTDRGHNAGNLIEAAHMLYTHGIGQEEPLDINYLTTLMNMALVNYGLEIVPQQPPPPDDPKYRNMDVTWPSEEERKGNVIDFPQHQEESSPDE